MNPDLFDGVIGDNAKQALKGIIEQIERLEDEKTATSEIIKEVYAEAKGTGFDTKIIRSVIRRRKIEKEERDQIDTMINFYEDTLEGMEELLS